MPNLKSGSIVKYIMGESSQSFSSIEKMVLTGDADMADLRDDCLILAEDIAAYKIIMNSINKNKWKEGIHQQFLL